MFDTPVPEGALFYGKARRRERVPLDALLREQTTVLAARLHALWSAQKTPSPEPGPKCEHCSLVELCMPRQGSASDYLQRMLGLP
jgi:CRISPR-associated exonuclease Cas4